MKLACLLADGFEDVEAVGVAALLRRAGIEVDYYSVYNKERVTGYYKTTVTDLLPMMNLNVSDYDGIFIPGGKAVFTIREEQSVKAIVQAFNDQEKWMFAICAGPTVFGLLGLMDNVHYISFPTTEKEMGKAIRVEQKAVRDGRFITGKSAGSIYEFVFEIIRALQGEAELIKFKKNMVY